MRRALLHRRILITGASRGIGRNLAELAVKAGARVLLSARSLAPLQDLAASLAGATGTAVVVSADITQAGDRQRLLEEAVRHFGGLDVLINNAGVGSCASFAESSEQTLRQVMEVNFFAPAELIRLAIPILEQGREPAIVNVADVRGRRGTADWSDYSASKFALCGLTEALRGEMARFDIDVLLIVPGDTDSSFRQHLLRRGQTIAREGLPSMPAAAVASRILDSLQRNRAETIVGRKARWLLWGQRFWPGLLDCFGSVKH